LTAPQQDESATSTPTGDRAGLLSFLIGVLVLTPIGFVATAGFVDEVCSGLVGADALTSLKSTVKQAEQPVTAESATWTLNQVGMCLDAGVLTGAGDGYPPTLGLAFASMLLGLLGAATSLAGRLWPKAGRTAPQLLSDLTAGGSAGLALVTLISILDVGYALAVTVGLGAFVLICMLILQRSPRWLAITLLGLLTLSMIGVLAASLWPSGGAREGALAWCIVLGIVAAASIGVAWVCSQLKLWWAQLGRRDGTIAPTEPPLSRATRW
jgi:hypothetical protein